MEHEQDHPHKTENFLVIVEPHLALYRYLEIARKRYRTLVLTSDPDGCVAGERKYNQTLGHPGATHIDKIIQCDTTQSRAMLEALKPSGQQVAGAVAGHDSFVPVTIELGRALGFDYAQPHDALCQQLKTAMKQRLAEHHVRTPQFVVARTVDEAAAAWETLGRNCMVKMVDYASSMNIYRVTTRSDLETAWDTIVHNKQGVASPFPLAREVLVEEYVGGRELTVEGYVQGDRVVILNFCEKVTESNFLVVGHYLPAHVSSAEEHHLRRIAEQCVRALGIRNSVFHVEVHLMNGVPYVIECASRPPGQHIVELMHRCYGFDLMDISIDLATGKEVLESARKPRRHYAMLILYSKKTGVLKKIEGLHALHALGGVLHLTLDVKVGDRVEALSTFHHRHGFVILEDESAAGVREKAAWVRQHVQLVVSDEAQAQSS